MARNSLNLALSHTQMHTLNAWEHHPCFRVTLLQPTVLPIINSSVTPTVSLKQKFKCFRNELSTHSVIFLGWTCAQSKRLEEFLHRVSTGKHHNPRNSTKNFVVYHARGGRKVNICSRGKKNWDINIADLYFFLSLWSADRHRYFVCLYFTVQLKKYVLFRCGST